MHENKSDKIVLSKSKIDLLIHITCKCLTAHCVELVGFFLFQELFERIFGILEFMRFPISILWVS